MQDLKIKATKYTPEIDFNAAERILNITGKSYPENTFEHYRPIVAWVQEYLDSLQDEKTVVNLELEYLNSSSSKAYFDLFEILDRAKSAGKAIEVNWIYDEENDIAEETGEDFVDDFENLNIQLVVKS